MEQDEEGKQRMGGKVEVRTMRVKVARALKGRQAEGGSMEEDEDEEEEERRVGVQGVTSTSAQVRWDLGSLSAVYAVWMYQIQYNCTADETLIYRILPSTSDRFLLKNLVSGADYNLCVLAIFDDTITSLAATKVLGCATFSTKDVYPACRSLHAHFLGGTLTILVGGVVVVTLLVFTVALMVRHRVCNHGDHMMCHSGNTEAGGGACCQGGGGGGVDKGGNSGGCYQSNGSGDVMMVVLPNGLPSKRGGEKDKDKEKEKEEADSASSLVPKPPPKPRPKPKVNLEQFLSAGGVVSTTTGAGEMALVVRQRKLDKAPPYTPESDRTPLYYSPSSTLPRQSHSRDRARPRLDRELTTRASFALAGPLGESDLLDWRISPRRDKWNSSQAYQSPLSPLSPVCGTVSKRRHSLDMGSSVALATADAAATVAKRYGAVNYAKRLSVIWTRRSQSLHGMLVQCASTTSTTSSATSDEESAMGYGAHCEFQRGYIHAYNTTNSNSNAGITAGKASKDRGRLTGKEGRSAEELEESVV
ncbi:hypothetical protein PBY51_006104 [Eleginops maclovinus]|uniref:Fibronectin type-III domain-containing protein n=1 Tax=Eleginops maclovinus TaxID=56733 RepID=A0AAN7WT89_ELEMC|nr:hypothetical protein PBY51_006104 [Eleginops maclovinus]